jgi:hypothetical protein
VKLTVNLATIAGMLKIRLSFKDAQGIGLIGLVLLVIGSALIVNLGPHSEWLEGVGSWAGNRMLLRPVSYMAGFAISLAYHSDFQIEGEEESRRES